MLDFVEVKYKFKNGLKYYYPEFKVNNPGKDLMIRGKNFYAIWDEAANMWSTDEYDVCRLIDDEIFTAIDNEPSKDGCRGLYLRDFSSNMWREWQKFVKSIPDRYSELDTKVIFSNTEVKKDDYASKRLNYPLKDAPTPNYDKLIGTLYEPEQRQKLEWAIGAIIFGESKDLQKFIVLYGSAGSGKSTVLNIIQKLFDGYFSVFEAKALGSSNNSFALEAFRDNPLVAIQHDGDLSKIEDNTKLNSIVSHEKMLVNEKFKSQYESRFNSFLFMGTNTPVRITDAKSGILRRLIDVYPSGKQVPFDLYLKYMDGIEFELGGIAWHCLEVYKRLGRSYYDQYVPVGMMSATNDFYDFIEHHFKDYSEMDMVTLDLAWTQYKDYVEWANIPYALSHRKFKEELKNYFEQCDGKVYTGFKREKFTNLEVVKVVDSVKTDGWIIFKSQKSLFDTVAQDFQAQYAAKSGSPARSWDEVTTKLSDLDTHNLHYVRVPKNHIVIDFDLKDKDGKKDYILNLEAANKFPPTYAELSKSGSGIHLHYIYDGDVDQLSSVYSGDTEVKVYRGKAALRRALSRCNDLQIAHISSGLPLRKEVNKTVNEINFKNEATLKTFVKRAMNKEYKPQHTAEIVSLIKSGLDKAYSSGMQYDISDIKDRVITFAACSTNQSNRCLEMCAEMHFKSKDYPAEIDDVRPAETINEEDFIFYDVEVFPNFCGLVYKKRGGQCVKLYNPDGERILKLVHTGKLIGFNNKGYDNHILYARAMGYSIEDLYKLSRSIIANEFKGFAEARNWSLTDIYDFAKTKQSLKKWEIELSKLPKYKGKIRHHELGLPWDEPVPEDMIESVMDYCCDDVIATEILFDHLHADWIARRVLADLTDSTYNESTNTLTTRLIFGKNRNPGLVYTDLATGKAYDKFNVEITDAKSDILQAFPGYEYKFDEKKNKYCNIYRGEDVGKGGYVYAEPGIYHNVALLDIASMHPHSIIAMNCFGEYTKAFEDLVKARVAIKHHDYEAASKMFDGKLKKYLTNDDDADDLAGALKIAINSVYGLTSASFKTPFKDERNVNNIVALRGALFMVNLKHEVQERGFTVAHIKTDSIKIPYATPEIINFVMDYGKKYGYTFEHEETYERMCLVNDAVYIAKYKTPHKDKETGKDIWWTATGTQFQVPFVFKTLFSRDPIEFIDMCETKQVANAAIYLDMNEDLAEGEHSYKFVGRIGQFCPIKPGCGGGELLRYANDKYTAVTGSKGYRWLESEDVTDESIIDISYYSKLVDDAKDAINVYGDFDSFVHSNDIYMNIPNDEELPF